jgi:hypothetical protein
MYDLYTLLHNLYKTTDEMREIRKTHQKFRANWDMDITIDTDSIANNKQEINEIESRHISAITDAYEQLPRNLYMDVRDTVLKYAHRDDVCGCCHEHVRLEKRDGLKPHYQMSTKTEYRFCIAYKECKLRICERIRDEFYEVATLKRHQSTDTDIDAYIKQSRATRREYINDLYYDRPYLEPYNICLFWNVEMSKSVIGQILCEIVDIEQRLEMDYVAYKEGRGWGHY